MWFLSCFTSKSRDRSAVGRGKESVAPNNTGSPTPVLQPGQDAEAGGQADTQSSSPQSQHAHAPQDSQRADSPRARDEQNLLAQDSGPDHCNGPRLSLDCGIGYLPAQQQAANAPAPATDSRQQHHPGAHRDREEDRLLPHDGESSSRNSMDSDASSGAARSGVLGTAALALGPSEGRQTLLTRALRGRASLDALMMFSALVRAADEACGPLPTRLERIESGDLPAEDHHSNHMQQQQQEQQQQDRERGSRLSAASTRPHYEGVPGVARSPRGPRPRLGQQQQDLAAAATAAAAALAFSSPLPMPGGRLSPSSFAPPWGRGAHQRGSQQGMLYGSNSAGVAVGSGTRRGSSESSTASHHTNTTGSGALAAAAAAAAAAALASAGISPRAADAASVGAVAGDTGFTFSPPHPVVSPVLGTANSLGRSAGVASGGAGRWEGGGTGGHMQQQQYLQQQLSPGQRQGSLEANRSMPDSPQMDPGDTKVLEMFARLLTQVSNSEVEIMSGGLPAGERSSAGALTAASNLTTAAASAHHAHHAHQALLGLFVTSASTNTHTHTQGGGRSSIEHHSGSDAPTPGSNASNALTTAPGSSANALPTQGSLFSRATGSGITRTGSGGGGGAQAHPAAHWLRAVEHQHLVLRGGMGAGAGVFVDTEGTGSGEDLPAEGQGAAGGGGGGGGAAGGSPAGLVGQFTDVYVSRRRSWEVGPTAVAAVTAAAAAAMAGTYMARGSASASGGAGGAAAAHGGSSSPGFMGSFSPRRPGYGDAGRTAASGMRATAGGVTAAEADTRWREMALAAGLLGSPQGPAGGGRGGRGAHLHPLLYPGASGLSSLLAGAVSRQASTGPGSATSLIRLPTGSGSIRDVLSRIHQQQVQQAEPLLRSGSGSCWSAHSGMASLFDAHLTEALRHTGAVRTFKRAMQGVPLSLSRRTTASSLTSQLTGQGLGRQDSSMTFHSASVHQLLLHANSSFIGPAGGVSQLGAAAAAALHQQHLPSHVPHPRLTQRSASQTHYYHPNPDAYVSGSHQRSSAGSQPSRPPPMQLVTGRMPTGLSTLSTISVDGRASGGSTSSGAALGAVPRSLGPPGAGAAGAAGAAAALMWNAGHVDRRSAGAMQGSPMAVHGPTASNELHRSQAARTWGAPASGSASSNASAPRDLAANPQHHYLHHPQLQQLHQQPRHGVAPQRPTEIGYAAAHAQGAGVGRAAGAATHGSVGSGAGPGGLSPLVEEQGSEPQREWRAEALQWMRSQGVDGVEGRRPGPGGQREGVEGQLLGGEDGVVTADAGQQGVRGVGAAELAAGAAWGAAAGRGAAEGRNSAPSLGAAAAAAAAAGAGTLGAGPFGVGWGAGRPSGGQGGGGGGGVAASPANAAAWDGSGATSVTVAGIHSGSAANLMTLPHPHQHHQHQHHQHGVGAAARGRAEGDGSAGAQGGYPHQGYPQQGPGQGQGHVMLPPGAAAQLHQHAAAALAASASVDFSHYSWDTEGQLAHGDTFTFTGRSFSNAMIDDR